MLAYFDHLTSKLQSKAVIWKMETATEKDELGQYPVGPTPIRTVWCQVVPQTGSLLNGRAGETQISRTTHKVIIRYRTGITPDMWLEIGGVRYDILYILDPYLKHISLELFCEARYGDSPVPVPEPVPEVVSNGD